MRRSFLRFEQKRDGRGGNETGNMHSKDIFKDVLIKIARGYFILVNVLGIFYTNFTNLITFYAKQECL